MGMNIELSTMRMLPHFETCRAVAKRCDQDILNAEVLARSWDLCFPYRRRCGRCNPCQSSFNIPGVAAENRVDEIWVVGTDGTGLKL